MCVVCTFFFIKIIRWKEKEYDKEWNLNSTYGTLFSSFTFWMGAIDGVETDFCSGIRQTAGVRFRFALSFSKSRYNRNERRKVSIIVSTISQINTLSMEANKKLSITSRVWNAFKNSYHDSTVWLLFSWSVHTSS